MLLSKRDEIPSRNDLGEEYKQTLRFATPEDDQKRVFSGQLNLFAEAKAKKDDHKLIVQLLKHNSKRQGQPQVEHPFKQFKSNNKPINKGLGYESPPK